MSLLVKGEFLVQQMPFKLLNYHALQLLKTTQQTIVNHWNSEYGSTQAFFSTPV